jgi:2-polyprenyl-6-methoxyphenol hydroxylase-like FAD-dependent oxidoreductase
MKKDLITQSLLNNRSSESSIAVDVCVLGAGPVAAIAVLQARQQGLRVVQIAPKLNTSFVVPRLYAITPAVQQRLLQLGVWGLINTLSIQPCTDMRVFWQLSAKALYARPNFYPIHLSADTVKIPELCSFITEEVLLVTQGQSPAHLFYDTQTLDCKPQLQVHTDGINIRLNNQALVVAQLCIVAEGANSSSAAQINRSPTVFDYKHHAVVAELHAQVEPHLIPRVINTAWQWLGNELNNDVLALLPMGRLTDNENKLRYSLVWSQASTLANEYINNPDALLMAIQKRIANSASELFSAGALSLQGAIQQFPLFASRTPYYTAPRTVLVGDAAHKIHPLAGQGLNLGFEDVFALFDIISQRESWRSLGDERILSRYQRQRSAQVNPIDMLIHTIATRHTLLPPIKAVLQLGLQLQTDIPVIGEWFRQCVVRRMAAIPSTIR